MARVSIGLPVYNGENFLSEALDSLLAQSYRDFELIISDNASTDGTGAICRAYAAKDRRIRYYRNDQNLGAARNFNQVFHLASGEYFKWAAHDDVLAPTFLEKCVRILDADPGMVLCHSKTRFIDAQGHLGAHYRKKLNIDSAKPSDRFHDLVLLEHGCFWIFGVIRSAILKKTSLIGAYTASDRVLLGELALHGRFGEVPEYLFSRRDHPQQSIMIYDSRERYVWFDPSTAGKINFLTWRMLCEYSLILKRAPVNWRDRVASAGVIAKWLLKSWKGLAFDLVAAGKQVIDLFRQHQQILPKRLKESEL